MHNKKKKKEEAKLRSSDGKKRGKAEIANIIDDVILDPHEEARLNFQLRHIDMGLCIERHIKNVNNWSGLVSFKDMHGSKSIGQIYVNLDTYLMPLRTHMSSVERKSVKQIDLAIFDTKDHCVVLGQPGAGKTTSMKKICWDFFSPNNSIPYIFPILISFRSLLAEKNKVDIVSELVDLVKFDFSVLVDGEDFFSIEEMRGIYSDISLSVLDSLKPLIILDGFDELPSHEDKQVALNQIRVLSQKFKFCKMIITCRTGEFNYHVDGVKTFEIAPLSRQQITVFVQRWLGDEDKSRRFIDQVYSSPFSDTAIKPLSLAHLCAIFERIGTIPDRPKTVYRKIVNLMLEEWDEQRSIKRESRYSRFESDRKFEFLTHLSFQLTVSGRSVIFSKEQLVEAYLNICANFGLPMSESVLAANEIESHTGLFVQTGYEQYEFAHKSLQEYLSAEYLVKLPSLEIIRGKIEILGAELAVATSISSNPSLYFSDIVLGLFNRGNLSPSFYNAFVSRVVQEKPDFYSSEELVLAIFSLINSHGGDDRIYEYSIDRINEVDLRGLMKYYSFSLSTDNSFFFRRKQNHNIYKLSTNLKIPVNCYRDEYI